MLEILNFRLSDFHAQSFESMVYIGISWHIDGMLDLLSDILTKLSLKGTLYFRTSFTEPWGVKVPAFENVARFHYVHRGECVVRVLGEEGVHRLAKGDLILIPHGQSHVLNCRHSGPEDALPLDDVIERSGYDGSGVLVFGGDEPDMETQLICGHFSLAHGSRHLLFDRLPSSILIRDYGTEAGDWLETTLRVIGSETASGKFGADLISLKLSEAIFAQAIRRYIADVAGTGGPLSGFADSHLSRALTAFHRDPVAAWSVATLAREAALSRTSFSLRFSEKLGIPPMQYVTSWRMQIARNALAGQGASVAEAADLCGYASEAAFSRAFKKELGLPPSTFRSMH